MKNFVLMLAGEWILKHRSEDKMPVTKVREFMMQKFGPQVSFTRETYSVLEFSFNQDIDKEMIHREVGGFLGKNYNDYNNGYLSVYEEKGSQSTSSPTVPVTPQPAPQAPTGQMGNPQEIEQFLRSIGMDTSGVRHGSTQQTSPTVNPTVGGNEATQSEIAIDNVMKEIDGLISGAEFKSLCREIRQLAGMVKQNKSYDVFTNQRYLFAINDGCCFDDYIKLFRKLLTVLGIYNAAKYVFNEKLMPVKPNQEDPRMVMLDKVRSAPEKAIICIDISDWMNEVKSSDFKDFLRVLASEREKSIIIFRIPFVDKEVMDNIGHQLNDTMFIRSVSFPPFTNEELGKIADIEISSFGFSMDAKAWNGFYARMRQESSDGRFYGTDTVKKVVRELLYYKLRASAQNGENDKIIREQDAEMLCSSDFVDNLTGMEMLERMVGTENIRDRILEIISQIELARQNPEMGSPCLHMRFVGNPGTGKTTVARIIGKILKEKGILRIGEFHEHAGRDFCGRYIGETAPKTLNICRSAYGSVLFIDEAYSLYHGEDDTKDFGREALDTLIAEMENHRSDFVVIMAGYTNDMDRLMKGNAGLLSRMPYTLEFPNFTKDQLFQIFEKLCNGKIEHDDEILVAAKQYIDKLDDDYVASKEFSNARFVRNLYERVCAKASMRCQLAGSTKLKLLKEDFDRAIADKEFGNIKNKTTKISFGQ